MTNEEKMTPEEAIAEISFLKVAVNEVIEQALDMAIQALSQEPTEKPMTVDEMEREYEKSKALFHKIVKCDDAISRDMALEKMADYVASGYADSAEDFEEYSRIICQLPPVTPKSETVTEFADRCRECGARYGKLLEQKSGKWIDYRDDGFVECPFCGHATNCEDNIDELHYCFYCGAKMESEDR